MEVRLTQLDSKFKCLFTAFVIVTEKSGLNTKIIGKKTKKNQNKKTRERWRLISLSFTKTMWDLQVTGEREVLYTALMPQNEKIQRQYLRHASTTVRNWPHIHQVMMTEWRRTQKHCRQINWHYYQRTSNNINSVWQTSGVPRATWTKITSANCGPRCEFSTTCTSKNKRGRLGKTIKCVQLRVNLRLCLSKKLERNQEKKEKKDDQCTTRPRESAH